MREIKFRAKDTACGHWTVGFIYEHKPPLQCFGGSIGKSTWWIHRTGFADWSMLRPIDQVEIDPETIGEFTGLKDKNGKEIYEGDQVKHNDNIYEIKWAENFAGWHGRVDMVGMNWRDGSFFYRLRKHIEVIGNIYENKVSG